MLSYTAAVLCDCLPLRRPQSAAEFTTLPVDMAQMASLDACRALYVTRTYSAALQCYMRALELKPGQYLVAR